MSTFPLIRVKWSNEHSMVAVLLVLILYHLPQWSNDPVGIFHFLLLVGVGLLIDSIASLLRHKRLWCCVSGAITAAMISLLTQGIPLWGQLLGIVVALILGKHLWGGTGKNLLNPAMVGLLPIVLLFELPYPFFGASLLALPAVILSIVLLKIRPFAGLGFILGMLVALYFHQELTVANVISYGVFFWGCLVMTDPVTVAPHKVGGLVVTFMAGFIAIFYFPVPIAAVIATLTVNLISVVIRNATNRSPQRSKAKFQIPKTIPHVNHQTQLIDLSKDKISGKQKNEDIAGLSAEKILDRIRENDVFGMGGAAFSTHRKILSVLTSEESEKFLIINGAECDPGLIHDEWLMQEHFDEIVQGAFLLNQCVNFKSLHLAVKAVGVIKDSEQRKASKQTKVSEQTKASEQTKTSEQVKSSEYIKSSKYIKLSEHIRILEHIKIHQLPDRYPVGAERILVAEVLKKQLAHNQIPAASGILVLNVQTVYAIYQAVITNKPTDTRFITVANLMQKIAHVVKVNLGMKIRDVMELIYPGEVNIFVGGGIMQACLAEDEAIVDKNVNFIAAGNLPDYKESPQCSRCGICVRNCPSGLRVNRIVDLVDQGKINVSEKYHVRECIACGSCSYSCPAGRNLAARVKMAKESIKDVVYE